MAPSTPPPPISCEFAALTVAPTAKVVMSPLKIVNLGTVVDCRLTATPAVANLFSPDDLLTLAVLPNRQEAEEEHNAKDPQNRSNERAGDLTTAGILWSWPTPSPGSQKYFRISGNFSDAIRDSVCTRTGQPCSGYNQRSDIRQPEFLYLMA